MSVVNSLYLPDQSGFPQDCVLPEAMTPLNICLQGGAPVLNYLQDHLTLKWVNYQVAAIHNGGYLSTEDRSQLGEWKHLGSIEQLHFFYRRTQQ